MEQNAAVDVNVLMEAILKLQQELIEMKKEKPAASVSEDSKKNHVPGTPKSGRTYVRIAEAMSPGGLIPQQQMDIAKILVEGMELGVPYSEEDVFIMLVDGAGDYPALYSSKQDVTYLFRYYRSVKKNKYLGFIGRNFLQMK